MFKEIDKWAKKTAVRYVVGAKSDLERKVTNHEAAAYAAQKGSPSYEEVSSKDNTNIQSLLETICRQWIVLHAMQTVASIDVVQD